MTYRLATAKDADRIALLLRNTGQTWSKEDLDDALSSPNRFIVLELDAAGLPTGAFCHALHRPSDGNKIARGGPVNGPTGIAQGAAWLKALIGVSLEAMYEYERRWPTVSVCVIGVPTSSVMFRTGLDASAPELAYTVEGDGGRWYTNSWAKHKRAWGRMATAAIGSP